MPKIAKWAGASQGGEPAPEPEAVLDEAAPAPEPEPETAAEPASAGPEPAAARAAPSLSKAKDE